MPNFAKIEDTLLSVSTALDNFFAKEIIPQIKAAAVPQLAEPMIYSLSAPGKRIRGALVFLCAGMKADSLANPAVFYVAAAVEALHTYSLIHDDLPAMDNGKLRRGRPACHLQYSEWAAILAGDGLHTFAFELLAKACTRDPRLDLQDLVISLNKGAGMNGMVSGQALDLSSARQIINGNVNDLLHKIHNKKTAALFASSCELGALLSYCSQLDSYRQYGYELGLLFQIKDDLLDVYGDLHTMGKGTGRDIDKLTYPAVFGLEASEKQCQELQKKITKLATKLSPGPNSQVNYQAQLSELAGFVLRRDS